MPPMNSYTTVEAQRTRCVALAGLLMASVRVRGGFRNAYWREGFPVLFASNKLHIVQVGAGYLFHFPTVSGFCIRLDAGASHRLRLSNTRYAEHFASIFRCKPSPFCSIRARSDSRFPAAAWFPYANRLWLPQPFSTRTDLIKKRRMPLSRATVRWSALPHRCADGPILFD